MVLKDIEKFGNNIKNAIVGAFHETKNVFNVIGNYLKLGGYVIIIILSMIVIIKVVKTLIAIGKCVKSCFCSTRKLIKKVKKAPRKAKILKRISGHTNRHRFK
ncbi:hypothetical protein [Mosqueiro virus]|uniref:Uncharacterized protein n=1 Tax=Mosqueiro virus TaxID=200403 RepID=A0A0D3R1J3_9RHAB|nr:hypothetical protein [Mosqueiro virus]AJR28523.1 hypothetical protein [Mosqueiro virus]